jgi:hypothetical protein
MALPRRPLTHFAVIAAGPLHERIGPGGSPWLISRHLDNVCDRVRPTNRAMRASSVIVSSVVRIRDIGNEAGA